VAKQLAKEGKPYTVAEFVKSFVVAAIEELCLEMIKLENLGISVHEQLKEKAGISLLLTSFL
jgi:DNA-directed RNA polymerase subunit K/omega